MDDKWLSRFDFHNKLVVGNSVEEKSAKIAMLIREGYDCYIVSRAADKYSENFGQEKVYSPENAARLLEFISDIAKRRYVELNFYSYKKTKEFIDKTPPSDKTILIIDKLEDLIPYKNKIKNCFLSLLAKGYAAKICFVVFSDGVKKTDFYQSVASFCKVD